VRLQEHYPRECQRCGRTFQSKGTSAKYCPECKPLVAKEQQRRAYIKKGGIPKTGTWEENREYYKGCKGCVDYAAHYQGCGFSSKYGILRPWPFRAGGGCAGWTDKPRRTEDWPEYPWDTDRAREMIQRGEPVAQIAKELGRSVNALNAWARKCGIRNAECGMTWDELEQSMDALSEEELDRMCLRLGIEIGGN
jgi:hypothetical protein